MRKAADQGDAGAQYGLGVRSYRASVIRPSLLDVVELRIDAYKWLQLASAQGYGDSAMVWELATLHMSRTEVEEGNHRAAAFVPGIAPVCPHL